jgi:hypothetical protein
MAIKEFGDRDVYVTEHNMGRRCRVRIRNLRIALAAIAECAWRLRIGAFASGIAA